MSRTNEQLRAQIDANPHLGFARELLASKPQPYVSQSALGDHECTTHELAVQTIANELGATVEEVAAALGRGVVRHQEGTVVEGRGIGEGGSSTQ